MRIESSSTAARATKAPPGRTVDGFRLSDANAGPAPSQAAALRSVGTIETLLALQGFEDPAERRRRTVKHGQSALDMLDVLKAGLLSGEVDPSQLYRLKSLSGGFRETSGDPGLDAVMAEIELRVEVELAKAGIR